jgi:hypothetical protein
MYRFPLNGKFVTLVDTPGFDNSIYEDKDVFEVIKATLRQGGDKKLDAIIYLQKISDIRIGRAARSSIRLFQGHGESNNDFGPTSMSNIILATSRWDLPVTESEGIQREKKLESHDECWKVLKDNGSRVARFTGSRESALELISLAMGGTPQALKVSRETVDSNDNTNVTGPRKLVNEELEKLREDLKNELIRLWAEMREAKEEKQAKDSRTENFERDIIVLREQQQMLKDENEKAKETIRCERESNKQLREKMSDMQAEREKKQAQQIDQIRKDMEQMLTAQIEPLKKAIEGLWETDDEWETDEEDENDKKGIRRTMRMRRIGN